MNATLEHDRLVTQARKEGGWTGCLVASYAGIIAAEHDLDIACPFGPSETMNAEWWERGRAQGAAMMIPKASVTHLPTRTWAPKPGTTHAARCAVED